jgi:hypothetical protein
MREDAAGLPMGHAGKDQRSCGDSNFRESDAASITY